MEYTETLIVAAKTGNCPGCGPTLQDMSSRYSEKGILNKYCTCCGWTIWVEYDKQGGLSEVQFSSMPLNIDGENHFTCAIDHPEHRGRWPQPKKYNNQPDPFTPIELLQKAFELDGRHQYLLTKESSCSLCGTWAAHEIGEHRPNLYDQAEVAALCCDCFEDIFGPYSHKYSKVTEPFSIGDN